MDHIETCVIGGGVVGLAIAARLAASSASLIVLDAGPSYGQYISSRNSEVIHAGIYYPKGSLKATLCKSGKEMLYDYCERNKVGCNPIGKLISVPLENNTEFGLGSEDAVVNVLNPKPVYRANLGRLEPDQPVHHAGDLPGRTVRRRGKRDRAWGFDLPSVIHAQQQ